MNTRRDTPAPDARHERYNVSDASLLETDTWADEPAVCPSCGAPVSPGRAQCAKCGQWLEHCSRSCASCASPRCIGGGRASR